MTWSSIKTFQLDTNWIYTDPVDGDYFRLTQQGNPIADYYLVAQAVLNEDGSLSLYNVQPITEDIVTVKLEVPLFFEAKTRRIAIRYSEPPGDAAALVRQVINPIFLMPTDPYYAVQRFDWTVRAEVSDQITADPVAGLKQQVTDLATAIAGLSSTVAVVAQQMGIVAPEVAGIAPELQQIEQKIGQQQSSSSTPTQTQSTSSSQSTSPTPATIFGSDLIGWYRADTATSSNGMISQWTDLSGNNHHAVQPASINQPTLNYTGFNGKPVVSFGNKDAWFALPNMLDPNWGQASLFIVYNLTDTTSHWVASSLGSGTDTYWGTHSQYNYAGYFGEFRSLRLEGQPPNMTVPGQHLVEVISSPSSYSIFRDTINLINTTPLWGITSTPFIGKGTNANRMNGDIAEFIIVKRAATDAERQSIEQYTKSFWNLTAW